MTQTGIDIHRQLLTAIQDSGVQGYVNIRFEDMKQLLDMAQAYLDSQEKRGGYATEEQQ